VGIIIIVGTIILRRLKRSSHDDLYPDGSIKSFTLGSEILNKYS
jgi:hypothetical protein